MPEFPAQLVPGFQYDDPAWTFTMTTVGSISGDTYKLNVTDKTTGALIFSVIPTILDIGSSTTKGIISADLTAMLDIDATDYTWELFRTNVGRRKTIADGTLSLAPSSKEM